MRYRSWMEKNDVEIWEIWQKGINNRFSGSRGYGTAQWDVECNTGRNIPNMKQNVPEEDEVLKQIDGLIENKNSSLSDWICSNGIKNYTSHEIFLRTFLSCRKVRRNKLIVDKMVRSCVARGLSLLDRTITKKNIHKASQTVLYFIQWWKEDMMRWGTPDLKGWLTWHKTNFISQEWQDGLNRGVRAMRSVWSGTSEQRGQPS